ncbi:hypothetical protein YC2023_109906 [Brassica napus]
MAKIGQPFLVFSIRDQIVGPIWEKIVLSAASLEKTQLKNNLSEMDRGRRDRIDRSGMFDPPA